LRLLKATEGLRRMKHNLGEAGSKRRVVFLHTLLASYKTTLWCPKERRR